MWGIYLRSWGNSRSIIMILSTVPKDFVHQFDTLVDQYVIIGNGFIKLNEKDHNIRAAEIIYYYRNMW
jgi:hypothetical protein